MTVSGRAMKSTLAAVSMTLAFALPSQARDAFAQISAGGNHTCGVTRGGGVKCWGANYFGQLGDGTSSNRLAPVDVVGLANGVKAVSAGGSSSCALLDDGTVKCWGYNAHGQLGDGSGQTSNVPRDVSGLEAVASISAGGDYNCALTIDGRTLCWGHVSDGLFNSRTTDFHYPAEVPGLSSDTRRIAASPYSASAINILPLVCAIGADSAVRCTEQIDHAARVLPGVPEGALSVAVGGDTCVLTSMRAVKCLRLWGLSGIDVPVTRNGLDLDIVSIAAGGYTTCAVSAQGRAKCWSGLDYLDNGIGFRDLPVEIGDLRDVASISAGMLHACALLVDGQAYCWGTNGSGELGNGERATGASYSYAYSRPVGVIGFSEPAVASIPGPMSGHWWRSSEPGWGVHLAERGNALVGTIYTYDANGQPKWYIASYCDFAGSSQCTSALHEATGPTFLDASFDSSLVRLREVGSLKLQVADSGLGYTIAIDGVSRQGLLARFVFAIGAATLDVDYTDLWWNPQEPGWGLSLTHQSGHMFFTWYIYEAGKPVWYYATDCIVAGAGCEGALFRASGPPWAPAFDPTRARSVAVGSASLTFTDPNNASLSYTIGSSSGMRALTRYRFK